MFEKAKSAKHVTIINFNKSFVQLRSETKAFQQNNLVQELNKSQHTKFWNVLRYTFSMNDNILNINRQVD